MVQNNGNVPEEEEQIKLEGLRQNFNTIHNKIDLFKLAYKSNFDEKWNKYQFDDWYNTCTAFESVFVRLTKGEEQPEEFEDDGGCCRI